MRNITKFSAILSALVFALSCSGGSSEPNCEGSGITMKINGETQTFDCNGYGIDWNGHGHTLTLWFTRYTAPNSYQNIYIEMPYRKTGANKFEKLQFGQSGDIEYFEGNFLSGQFESKITSNRTTCVSGTFSGRLSDGSQEIVITEGVLGNQYDEPLPPH